MCGQCRACLYATKAQADLTKKLIDFLSMLCKNYAKKKFHNSSKYINENKIKYNRATQMCCPVLSVNFLNFW